MLVCVSWSDSKLFNRRGVGAISVSERRNALRFKDTLCMHVLCAELDCSKVAVLYVTTRTKTNT